MKSILLILLVGEWKWYRDIYLIAYLYYICPRRRRYLLDLYVKVAPEKASYSGCKKPLFTYYITLFFPSTVPLTYSLFSRSSRNY